LTTASRRRERTVDSPTGTAPRWPTRAPPSPDRRRPIRSGPVGLDGRERVEARENGDADQRIRIRGQLLPVGSRGRVGQIGQALGGGRAERRLGGARCSVEGGLRLLAQRRDGGLQGDLPPPAGARRGDGPERERRLPFRSRELAKEDEGRNREVAVRVAGERDRARLAIRRGRERRGSSRPPPRALRGSRSRGAACRCPGPPRGARSTPSCREGRGPGPPRRRRRRRRLRAPPSGPEATSRIGFRESA
jgi:hypothetical protein